MDVLLRTFGWLLLLILCFAWPPLFIIIGVFLAIALITRG